MDEGPQQAKKPASRFSTRMRIVIAVAGVLVLVGVLLSGVVQNYFSTGKVVNTASPEAADSATAIPQEKAANESFTGTSADETSDTGSTATSEDSKKADGTECFSLNESGMQRMILGVIKLRELAVSEDAGTVSDIADRVTYLDKRVTCIEDSQLTDELNELVSCAYEGCPPGTYLRFIDGIAQRSDTREANLTHQLIRTESYWNGKNVKQFYKEVSTTEQLISQYGGAEVSSAWQSLLDCNEECVSCKCDSFYERLFDCLRVVNE